MEHLWSPWRLPYITSANDSQGCLFCSLFAGAEEALVLFRGVTCFIVLNRFPYNNGHLMIAPIRHVATLAGLTADEAIDVVTLAQRAELALTETYHPDGINVGVNLGRPAGAGVVDHVHVHIVPRWTGDTNFMSVVGGVRVLPEELDATAGRLRPIFERLVRRSS